VVFRTYPEQPRGPPRFLYNGYRVIHRDKAARAPALPPTPSNAEVKAKVEAIPLLSLWAFMEGYRVKFIFLLLAKAFGSVDILSRMTDDQ
jgi:hypothetical protein